MRRYNPTDIEPKWQQIWRDKKAFEAVDFSDKPKTYISPMFPYPSGAGLHVGHMFEHAIVDAIARFYRSNGHDVLNPMGWDSFGLPAENYAIKTGTPPQQSIKANIVNFKNQLEPMGLSIDWTREINTSDPEYYRWTQWIFTKLFERDLAYQKDSLQWWCTIDQTVLANEQVIGGKCWRHDGPDDPLVEKRNIRQWFFKITDYADALLAEIPDLDWPEKIKTAQTNWIGRSQGAEIDFELVFDDEKLNEHRDDDGKKAHITVFTTRPDTIFGASFLVLAPEHKWVELALQHKTVLANNDDVAAYVKTAIAKSEIERQADSKEKTGIELQGVSAINPATGEKIPLYTADYVLNGYGTGAIMAVPAHDERDFAFAKKFELPIVQVIAPEMGLKRPNEKFADGGASVVFDPTTQKYAFAKLDNGRTSLFAGGRNEGEDLYEGILRELYEESGLTNVDHYEEAAVAYGHYYNSLKDINRFAKATALLVVLKNSDTVETALEEHEKFHLEWLDPAEVLKKWEADETKSYDHYQFFLKQAVGLAIERGYDTVSDPNIFSHAAIVGEGIMVHSGEFDGMPSSEAREKIVARLATAGVAQEKTTYKMRDWLISRQRYWGAPIPIIHCDEHGAVAVPEDQLPVVLPEIEDFAPKGDGKSALARVEDWVNTTCPTCGKPAKRETDTMDGYACSSWYLLRYTDPQDNERAWDPKLANYWAPVDFYVGGDHAVAHLLYVRFWTHVFHDMGLTDFKEPVKKLVYHGLISAEDGRKMSKSLGNTVDPLDVIKQGYGADSLRTFELFLGPIEENSNWSSTGIAGVYRFLNRVWTLVQEFDESDKSFTGHDTAVIRLRHKTARKVTDDIRRLSFNTAIAALMEYVNDLYKLKVDGFSADAWHEALSVLAQLVSPFAPHMAEELWQQLGHEGLIQETMWPDWDDAQIVEETITVVVQVNGKLRGKLEVPREVSQAEIEKLALEDKNVQAFVEGKQPKKIIYIPGKLLNIVI